jgi:hypothetical protein
MRWVVTVVLIAGCQRSNPEQDAGRAIAWQPHRTLAYDLSLVTSTELPAQPDFALVLTATLELSVLSRNADHVELSMVLRDPKLVAKTGAQDPALGRIQQDLAKPAWFELAGGRVSKERFAPDLAPEAVATERSLVAALQLPSPAGSEAPWTTTELDGTGRYRARYAIAPAGSAGTTVTKQRIAYEDLLAVGKLGSLDRQGLLPKVIHSELVLQLDRGQLARIHGEEQLETPVLGSKVVGRSSLDLQLRRAVDAPDLGDMRDALLASTRDVAPDSAYGAAPARNRFDRLRAGDQRFEDVVQALAREGAAAGEATAIGQRNGVPVPEEDAARSKQRLGRRLELFSSLVALLRQAPENVARTRQLIDSGSPSSIELVDVLGSAGTPLAQAALCEIALDPTRARPLRGAAATSLIRLEQPAPATIATLQALVQDPVLTDFGVFGLGSASRRLREQGDIATADRLASDLVEQLQVAPDDRARIQHLRGIANSAYPGAVAAIEPFLKAKQRHVRAAAVEALRLVRTPAADALVAATTADTESSIVRNTAVRVAATRAPSDVLVEALKRLALDEPDDATRQHAVEVIARWLPRRDDLRLVLEQVSRSDRQQPIRDVALRALKES